MCPPTPVHDNSFFHSAASGSQSFGRKAVCPLVPVKSWEEAWWALNVGLLSWPGRGTSCLYILSGLILMAPVGPSDGTER